MFMALKKFGIKPNEFKKLTRDELSIMFKVDKAFSEREKMMQEQNNLKNEMEIAMRKRFNR